MKDWKPIVVGVDGTPESVRAAVVATTLSQRAGTTCTPVVAVPDYRRILSGYGLVGNVDDSARDVELRDRDAVAGTLKGYLPDNVISGLEVHAGRAALVLARAAKQHDAGLIVVGSRPHHLFGRLRRSVVSHLLRTCDVPILVANSGSPNVFRVLAALDLSYASRVTYDAAHQWARLFGAHLRALHVIEPMPMLPGGATAAFAEEYYRADDQLRQSGLWAEIPDSEAAKVVHSGDPAEVIANEASQWRADIVVVGTHGRGWVDRLIIGSTTEQLLHRVPSLLLIIPVGTPKAPEKVTPEALPWEKLDLSHTAGARH